MNAIEAHVNYCLQLNPALTPMDRVYLINRVRNLVGDATQSIPAQADPLDNLDALVAGAVENGAVDDLGPAKQILEAELMALGTPTPSEANAKFWDEYQTSPKAATDWFFQLSRANNYIQTRAIAKNIGYTTPTEYGDLEITINLSKPEKDPKAIAAAAHAAKSGYPACQLCMENEGYAGRLDYPARANHRIIRFGLAGKTWGFQYSPYAYFNEHAIFLDAVHEPMHINAQTFTNLLDLTTMFPHYMVGSNADLPIVGGSMLAHEHYQGGRHDFAMAKANIQKDITIPGFDDVDAGIVHWPMSVIRLTSSDRTTLAQAAEHVRATWADYSDESVSIKAHAEDGTPHHTITPIARRVGDAYQLDLVLRDNQTSAQYPDGIFHPHQDVQHIKKENIGLIEVMGLAILPARLLTELAEVQKYLLDEPNHIADMHKPWADELKASQTWTADTAQAQLRQEVGKVFARVLEDAGVFKQNDEGLAAFDRFIAAL